MMAHLMRLRSIENMSRSGLVLLKTLSLMVKRSIEQEN